ncbi:hypothetical protein HPB50_013676 [Hyalomma asiaticum]|uniref:Uncharacterized protein n=1 Tax=Hyalomma asiaticum TaxID=266040 RepID=A0ACB7THM6_HYAAI|nr:hypothetical protein HPB50_013676 [Hyalomma asiaticum]
MAVSVETWTCEALMRFPDEGIRRAASGECDSCGAQVSSVSAKQPAFAKPSSQSSLFNDKAIITGAGIKRAGRSGPETPAADIIQTASPMGLAAGSISEPVAKESLAADSLFI